MSEDFGVISFKSQFTYSIGLYKDTIGLYRVGPKMVEPSATLASWLLPGVIAQELYILGFVDLLHGCCLLCSRS